jgi:hypothetical protein
MRCNNCKGACIKWGKQANGVQKYYCKSCRKSALDTNSLGGSLSTPFNTHFSFFALGYTGSPTWTLLDQYPVSAIVSLNDLSTNRSVANDVDSRSGKTVYVWTELDAAGTSRDVYCSVYDANYNKIVNSFRVNTSVAGEQIQPTVKIHQEDNSFIVAWAGKGTGTGADYDIYFKKISLDLTDATSATFSSASEFKANDLISLDQNSPKLAIDYSGNKLIIAYTGNESSTTRDAYARQFDYSDPNPATAPASFVLNHDTTTKEDQVLNSLEISSLTGELIAVYQYNSTAGTSWIFLKEPSHTAAALIQPKARNW